MQTKNFIIQTPQEIEDILNANAIEDNECLLVQTFVSAPSKSYLNALHQTLQSSFQYAHILGTSSDAAIANANIVSNPKTLLSITQFDTTRLLSYRAPHQQKDHASGVAMGKFFASFNPKVLIIFVDAFESNAEELLKGLYQELPDVVVCGGLASRSEGFEDTYIFDNQFLSNSGIVAVGLSHETLNVIEHFAFDWMPVGVPKAVTQASHNRVYAIDNMSAVAFYNKYLGSSVVDQLPDTGIEFPLIIRRGERYIGRAVLSKHDDGSLSFAGNINEGEKVQFGIGNLESIIQHSQNYAKTLPYSNIETIFVYSCVARRHFLGEDIVMELKALEKIAPTSGFFTFGEFYNQSLLNQSNRYIALAEKPLQKLDSHQHELHKFENQTNILKALLTLANATSKDLDSINSLLESKVIQQKEDIHRTIYFDDNTQLPNRIKLLQDITKFQKHHLILFNIDRFSRINYFYGFDVGDMLIRSLSSYLEAQFNAIGILYKLPSDEFALIVTDETIDIHTFIETISLELKMMLFNYQEIKVPYTVTMGIAKIIGDGVSMRHADISISHARLIHKPFAFYEDIQNENQTTIQNTTNLALTTREAILNKRICMHYQPIYDLKTENIYSYEALARFCITPDEILMPSEFLPILPYIHLSNDFLKLVIDETFKLFSQNAMKFSINLSIENILDDDINTFLCDQLQKYNLYNKLTIEILETVEIVASDKMHEFIKRAKSLGIKIAIDDFGSGFANFEYITKINADILKIDGSLIRNIDRDSSAKVIVETIVTFAKKLGMKTVAEYVHSQEVYEVVKALDIDYAQGFYLGKPLPNIVPA